MSYSSMFGKDKPQQQFAALLRPKGAVAKQEVIVQKEVVVKKSFCALLGGGKGGHYSAATKTVDPVPVTMVYEVAKALADHVKGRSRGKKADAKEHELAIVVKSQVVANDATTAQQLTDAGLNAWTKRKHDLPLLPDEKEFIEKSYAAAAKSYNQKMALKKSEEHKALLVEAESVKVSKGEDSREYRMVLVKAEKAAAKALEYGNKGEGIAPTVFKSTEVVPKTLFSRTLKGMSETIDKFHK